MLTPEFGHWLAGFVDGEGCFTVRKQSGARNAYLCEFAVCLRDDDAAVLDLCLEATGLGYLTRRSASALVAGAKPQVCWKIVRRAHCVRLCALLSEFPLRTKKRRDFEIWRDAVALWDTVSGGSAWALPPEYGAEMARIADALREVKRYRIAAPDGVGVREVEA